MSKWVMLIFFVALFLSPNIVKAETGTITVSDQANKTYSAASGGGQCPSCQASQETWTTFYFYKDGYNTLSWFSYSGFLTFNEQSGSTTFTITGGGTGGGTFSYSAYVSQLKWIFTPNTTITGTTFTISYTNASIKSGFSYTGGYNTLGVETAATSGKPVMYRSNQASSAIRGDYYANNIAASSSIGYNITYSQNLFTAIITKSGTVSNKVSLHGQNSIYQTETSFNSNSFTFSEIYNDGLYINLSLISGSYKNMLINSTNSGITDITKPSSGGAIAWQNKEYIVGDNAKYSWAIADTNWNWYTLQTIRVYKDGEILGSYTQTIVGSQTGNYTIPITAAGNYTVKLVEGLVFEDELDTDSMGARPESKSYILAQSPIPAKVATSVTYHIGYGFATTPRSNLYLQLKYFNGFEYIYEKSYNLMANDGSANVTFNKAGMYLVELYDFSPGKGQIATTTVETMLMPSLISGANITTSYLNLSKSVYYFGESLTGDYAIDDTNYTNFSLYAEIYSVDRKVVTDRYDANDDFLGNQYGKILLSMGDGNIEGQNTLTIYGFNSTNTVQIAQASFNITTTTTEGYGLSLSKYKVAPDEEFTISVITPGTSNLIIEEARYDGNKQIWNITISSSTTVKKRLSRTGFYDVVLIQNSDRKVSRGLEVTTENASATATATPTGQQTANEVADLLSSNVFWSFLISVGMMAVIAKKTKGNGIATGITGLIGISAFTLIGWLPSWILFSVIVLILLVLAIEFVSKQTSTGGGR